MRVRSTTRTPSRGSLTDGIVPRRPGSTLGDEVPLAHDHVAVLGVVRQLPAVAAPLLQVEGHAGVDGPAVDVERDGGLLALDDHLVDGLDLVHRVHRATRIALLDLAAVDVDLGGPGQ